MYHASTVAQTFTYIFIQIHISINTYGTYHISCVVCYTYINKLSPMATIPDLFWIAFCMLAW